MFLTKKTNKMKININQKKRILTKNCKTGVVITTHGFNGIFVKQALECYIRELPDNYFIVLYINESNDKIVLDLMNQYNNDEAYKGKIQVIYIEDQISNGGLTGTWNQGIDLCFKNNCDVIILSNDDILFDRSINNIIWYCYKNKDQMKYFGPTSNNPGADRFNTCQYALSPEKYEPRLALYKNFPCNLNGFFMVFSKHVLIKNKYNSDYYFDPKYPFGGNEMEWFERFVQKSGIGCVIPETFIYHFKLATWRKHSNFKEKIANDKAYIVTNLNKIKKQQNLDTLYFTNNFQSIYKSIRMGLLPMYFQTSDNDPDKILSIIKNEPTLYIPTNYKNIIYI